MDNFKFLMKGELSLISTPDNGLPVNQYYLQLTIDQIVQAAGDLFFGPDPKLREDDRKKGFDTEAKVIWTPKEYQMLSDLDSELISFLERYQIMDIRGRMEKAKRKKLNDEDLSLEEKKKVIKDSVDDMTRDKTNNEIFDIQRDFKRMFSRIETTFIRIRNHRRLETAEPIPFYPTTWEVSSTNRWKFLTEEQVQSNIMSRRLPVWLEEIIESVQNDKNTTVPLKFEPLVFRCEPKPVEIPEYRGFHIIAVAPLIVHEIECFDTVHGSSFHKMPTLEMVKRILDKDFDRIAEEFYEQASSSTAVPDINDFVLKQLERGHKCNIQILKVKEAVCEEIYEKMFPEGSPFPMHVPIPIYRVTPRQDNQESYVSDKDHLNTAVALSLLSFCAGKHHCQSRQVPMELTSMHNDNEIEFSNSAYAMILQEAKLRTKNPELSVVDVKNYAYKNANNSSSIVYRMLSKICDANRAQITKINFRHLAEGYVGLCDVLIGESSWDRFSIP
ncbi:hypothetical protein QAD02_015581 [Eretmocerus hayati]|uniref:Uncharacterized protein n=1 Tax=Eretmocerus hayati TaxID=131215 RepID=A0ACC2P860_9HYME|nr:hypothetical protein QAD02_015581 [Eretmocerus hayati]